MIKAEFLFKTCLIVPKKYRSISDILLQRKRIEEECTLENLDVKEIRRAMCNANVYEIIEGQEPLKLDELNYYLDNSGDSSDDTSGDDGTSSDDQPGGDGNDTPVDPDQGKYGTMGLKMVD